MLTHRKLFYFWKSKKTNKKVTITIFENCLSAYCWLCGHIVGRVVVYADTWSSNFSSEYLHKNEKRFMKPFSPVHMEPNLNLFSNKKNGKNLVLLIYCSFKTHFSVQNPTFMTYSTLQYQTLWCPSTVQCTFEYVH